MLDSALSTFHTLRSEAMQLLRVRCKTQTHGFKYWFIPSSSLITLGKLLNLSASISFLWDGVNIRLLWRFCDTIDAKYLEQCLVLREHTIDLSHIIITTAIWYYVLFSPKGKLRLREVKWSAQGCTASKLQSCKLNPDLAAQSIGTGKDGGARWLTHGRCQPHPGSWTSCPAPAALSSPSCPAMGSESLTA